MKRLPATISLPVTCPTCGSESLVEFPALVVMVALTQWNQLALNTTCHNDSWDATSAELDHIRRHVGQAWIDEQRGLLETVPAAPSNAPRRPKR